MAEKKRPRRTRERILETSLELFNRDGAPQVTTADIADEMDISPGNLYYHFGNKDEIVFELYTQLEAGVLPLYADRGDRRLDVDDLWLWLHLLFEWMWKYRFLYRDLDQLTSRDRQARRAVRRAAPEGRRDRDTVVSRHGGGRRDARVGPGNRGAGAKRRARRGLLVVVRSGAPRRPRARPEGDAGRAAYQVLALFGPYLDRDARAYLDRLAADYL